MKQIINKILNVINRFNPFIITRVIKSNVDKIKALEKDIITRGQLKQYISMRVSVDNIVLDNKCCNCTDLKKTYFKAFALYRALKIGQYCGIESHIPKVIKHITALDTTMTNEICTKC